MEKLNMQTTDVVDENIKRIGELFPNCLKYFSIFRIHAYIKRL